MMCDLLAEESPPVQLEIRGNGRGALGDVQGEAPGTWIAGPEALCQGQS